MLMSMKTKRYLDKWEEVVGTLTNYNLEDEYVEISGLTIHLPKQVILESVQNGVDVRIRILKCGISEYRIRHF